MMRQQLVDEAMRLFGERGYQATSVADIQLACGLTGGSGALYKHFPSKYALLEAGVRAYVAGLDLARVALVDVLPDDPRAAVELLAHATFEQMAHARAVIRVGLRDLEQFPELLQVLWDGLLATLYGQVAAWLTAQRDRGRIVVADPTATAAVLVASLTYHRVLDALIGHPPGDVGVEAYLAAWVDSAAASLHLVAREPA